MHELIHIYRNFCMRCVLVLLLISFAATARAQTIEQPVDISLLPVSATVQPGKRSAVELIFRIPHGFLIGVNDPSARNPVATVVAMQPRDYFEFEEPQFPTPIDMGVPVHKGVTHAFAGEIHVIIPFTVAANAPDGEYPVTVQVTYTPSLNVGRIGTHVREPYSTTLAVATGGQTMRQDMPKPFVREVPEDFLVKQKPSNLSQPWKSLFYVWPEDKGFTKFLHKIWLDSENHGKHVQTVWLPYAGFTENRGNTIGMSVQVINTTREGIMTSLVQLRGQYNEYNKATLGLEAVSCPGAYFNYWLSAEISADGINKQLHFHNENLTLGQDDRFGYELQLDLFSDPLYRFYGIGADTKEGDKTNYNHQEAGTVLDFYWLPIDHLRFAIGGKFRSVNVADGNQKLKEIMPFTTEEAQPGGRFENVPGIQGATIVAQRLSIVYDSRNSEFSPSAGFYSKVTAEYDQITDQVETNPESVDRYGRFMIDIRKYFSTIDQRFTLVLRNSWTLTTSKFIPFFDQATFGGPGSDRGFDSQRFYGQHQVFGSMELRYQAMHIVLLGMAMDLELAPFVDFGQVFDSDGFSGKFNINPGMSMRVLNRPNVGIVGNGAVGQDGLILTGGVSLPF